MLIARCSDLLNSSGGARGPGHLLLSAAEFEVAAPRAADAAAAAAEQPAKQPASAAAAAAKWRR